MKNSKLAFLTLAPGATLLSFSAFAQTSQTASPEAIPTLPAIVTTATRTPMPFADLISDATVLTREQIERSGAQDAAALLAKQASVELSRNGGAGAASSLFLRGTNSGHVLVLVDGVRVASSSTGTSPLEAIPMSDIERVEILRGAASALYGSDAIGGVVNIITKRAADGQTFAGDWDASCGSHRSCKGDLSFRGKAGIASWSAGFGSESSRGFNAIVDPSNYSYVPDRDGYQKNHQRASLDLTPASGQRVGVSVFRDRVSADIDSGAPNFDEKTNTVLTSSQLSGDHVLNAFWTARWRVAQSKNDSDTQLASGDSRFITRSDSYSLQNEFKVAPARFLDGKILLLLEHRREKLDSSTDYARDERDTNSAMLGYLWKFGKHAAQLSIRNDHATQYGDQTTGSFNYGYSITPRWKLTAGFGTAFKAPTFNDLYFPDYGNPDLKPEKARMFELGTRYRFQFGGVAGSAKLTAWEHRVKELINYVCDSDWVCAPENIDRAKIRGATLAFDANWKDYAFDGSLDWQLPRDSETGNLLARRSRVHGNFTVSKTWGNFYGSVNVFAEGKRWDDAANTVKLGGYATVNLVFEYRVPKTVLGNSAKFFIDANNLFDKEYQTAKGYATGGEEVMVGIRGGW